MWPKRHFVTIAMSICSGMLLDKTKKENLHFIYLQVSNEVNCAKASLQNVGTYRTITPTCTSSLNRNNVQRTPSLMRMKITDHCSSAATPSSVRRATLLPHPSSSNRYITHFRLMDN